jgi:hypothetical protein
VRCFGRLVVEPEIEKCGVTLRVWCLQVPVHQFSLLPFTLVSLLDHLVSQASTASTKIVSYCRIRIFIILFIMSRPVPTCPETRQLAVWHLRPRIVHSSSTGITIRYNFERWPKSWSSSTLDAQTYQKIQNKQERHSQSVFRKVL